MAFQDDTLGGVEKNTYPQPIDTLEGFVDITLTPNSATETNQHVMHVDQST